MKIQPIKPNVLKEKVSAAMYCITDTSKELEYPKNLRCDKLSEVLEYEETLRKILDYLRDQKFIKDYIIKMNQETPIIFVDTIELLKVDYDRCQAFILLGYEHIRWMMEAEEKGKDPIQDIWFKNDILHYQKTAIELSGFQARLCELLFDKTAVHQLVEDSDATEFITGDSFLDLKDLVKVVNKKLKKEFDLDSAVIKQKNGKIYRIL